MEEPIRELYNEHLDFLIDLSNKARLCVTSGDHERFRDTVRILTRVAEGLLWESGYSVVDLREEAWSNLGPGDEHVPYRCARCTPRPSSAR